MRFNYQVIKNVGLLMGIALALTASEADCFGQLPDWEFQLTDKSRFVRVSPTRWWAVRADGQIRKRPLQQVSVGNEPPFVVQDSYHGAYEYQLGGNSLKMRRVGTESWGNYFYNISGKLARLTPEPDIDESEPGAAALVNVELVNLNYGSAQLPPVTVYLKDGAGEEEWSEVAKGGTETLPAYPGNHFIFKWKTPQGPKVIDEYIVGDEPQQRHIIHMGNQLAERMVDGRELVFQYRHGDKSKLQYASQGHGQAKPHFRLQAIDQNSRYQWIAHHVVNDLVDGWALELKSSPGQFMGIDSGGNFAMLKLVSLTKTSAGKIDIDQVEPSALLKATWQLVPPLTGYRFNDKTTWVTEEAGLAFQNCWLMLESRITDSTNDGYLGKNQFGFVGCYGQHAFADQRKHRAMLPLDPVPWGKDANLAPAFKVIPSRSYAGWLRVEQPINPSSRSSMSGNLGEGFVGRLLANEVHSLTGFNILKMDPFDLQVHGQRDVAEYKKIFAPIDPNAPDSYYLEGDYRVPQCFFFKSVNRSQMEGSTSLFFSEKEVQKTMSLSVGVKGQAGNPQKSGAALGLQSKYSEKRRKVTSERRVARIKTKWAADFWLTIDKRNIKLDSPFVEYLLSSNRKFDGPADFYDLFERYGTHYALSTLYGGRSIEESFLEARSVMNSFEKSLEVSGQGEGAYKGVGGGANGSYSVGQMEASKLETSQENTQFLTSGGTGFGEMWDKGDSGNFAPIKVDLRPISEILRPELIDTNKFSRKLTEADVAKIDMIRSKSYQMLDRYLQERCTRIGNHSQEPKMFVASLDYIKCTQADDALNVNDHAPDLCGRLRLGAADYQQGRDPDWLFDNGTDVFSISDDDDYSLDKDQSLVGTDSIPFQKHSFGVFPRLVNKQVGGKNVRVWDYDYANEFVFVHCLIDDLDQSGRDRFRLAGQRGTSYPLISLDAVAREQNGTKTFKFYPQHDTAGKLEIAITVRMVNIDYDNQPAMPKAPYE